MFHFLKIIDSAGFNKHFESLTREQKQFVILLNEWFQKKSTRIILITGAPGTGKTYSVINTLDYISCNTLKAAPTKKISQSIGGQTLHSLLRIPFGPNTTMEKLLEELEKIEEDDINKFTAICYEKTKNLHEEFYDRLDFRNVEIVVIDEVGMIPFWFLWQIIVNFEKYKRDILFVLMGDENQLQPIKCKYNIFNINFNKLPVTMLRLTENKRFDTEYNRIIKQIKQICDENNYYKLRSYLLSIFPVRSEATPDILDNCEVVLAYKNITVQKYNEYFIDKLQGNYITLPKIIRNKIVMEDPIILKPHCKIVIMTNCELSNGTFGTFIDYDADNDMIIVLVNEKNFHIRRHCGQFPIRLAYAVTVHKYQGETINGNIVIDFDGSDDLHLIYTAISRVKCRKQILGIINLN